MFIPDQTKTDLAELLGDEKTLRKLKRTSNTNGSSNSGQPSVFGNGGVGDFDFGEECGDGCHSRSERREIQRNAAKAAAGVARKFEKRSWRQTFVGLVLLIAMSGGLFTTVWKIVDYLAGASLFPLVDLRTEEDKVKTIFFSGDPYVVYCQAGKSKLVPKLVLEGANMLPSGFSTAMIKCDEIIPSSGKTIYERFDLDAKGIPAFVVANGEKPKQFNRNSFYNPEYFAEFAKTQAVPKLKEVTNEIQLRNFCTEKQKCVAIGHKGKIPEGTITAIEETMAYWRKERFVSIDTAKYSIKLDEKLSESLERQMKEGKTGKGYLSVLCYRMPDREVDTLSPVRASVRRSSVSELYYVVKDCMNESGLDEIKQIPSLDIKKKKGTNNKKEEKKKSSHKSHDAPKKPTSSDGMEVEDIDDEM
jgi:hypothetical protein